MPVPFPSEAETNRGRPDAAEVVVLTRGIKSAAAPATGLTDVQRLLIAAIAEAMTGYPGDLDAPSITPEEFAAALAPRPEAFRSRIVQLMVLSALVLRPIPLDVAARVAGFARELMIDDGMLRVAQEFAAGTLGLAAFDFDRNGYTAEWTEPAALHTSQHLASAWDMVVHDPALAARWEALEELPPETLGRRVTDFYRARGFAYPGLPESAPPLLAQHDWVHVVADFGTTVESELEVFAFIARANDDMRAFSLLAMVVSLFETGYLRSGAGLFQSDLGHLSRTGVAGRLADAMRRGAECSGSIDYLATDWFALADQPVEAVRAHFGVNPKRVAGSPGPWEPGGISPYQLRAGRAQADAQGRPYDAFGACEA